jgi:hypothetical protein
VLYLRQELKFGVYLDELQVVKSFVFLMCILGSCICVACIVYVYLLYFMCIVLGVLLYSYVYLLYFLCVFVVTYVYLLYYVCIAVLTLDAGLEVSIRKVLRPATSTQVFLGFPVSTSEC